MNNRHKINVHTAPGYVITVFFEIKISFYERFITLVNDNAKKSIQLEPECFQFDVLTPIANGEANTIFLYEIYKDRAAFEDHLVSDHFQYFDAATKDMVLKKTVVDYFVETNSKA